MTTRSIIFIFTFPILVFTQDKIIENDYNLWVISQSAPQEMWSLLKETGLEKNYFVNLTHLNPFYYHGDFDGDEKIDYVLLLTNIKNKNNRLIILGGNKKLYWLDRDEELRYPSLTAWYVYPKYWVVKKGSTEDREPPKLIGDALMIIAVEASSALIYWNGERFVSYWQSD